MIDYILYDKNYQIFIKHYITYNIINPNCLLANFINNYFNNESIIRSVACA